MVREETHNDPGEEAQRIIPTRALGIEKCLACFNNNNKAGRWNIWKGRLWWGYSGGKKPEDAEPKLWKELGFYCV